MKIDLVQGALVDVVLMNALVGHFGDDKFFEEVNPSNGSEVDVILTVNGKPVPFDRLIEDMATQLTTIHDDQVTQKALELIGVAHLGDIQERVSEARLELKRALDAARQKLKGST